MRPHDFRYDGFQNEGKKIVKQAFKKENVQFATTTLLEMYQNFQFSCNINI